jgi:site-specific DNA-methyltransferase (adenine-specific)
MLEYLLNRYLWQSCQDTNVKNDPLPRLDEPSEIRDALLPHCRLKAGEIWHDPDGQHRVGCIDAADRGSVSELMGGLKSTLAVHDPPYNLVAFDTSAPDEFANWCRKWVNNCCQHFAADAAFYVWLGADQNDGFQPLPEFMMMMRSFQELKSRSFLTVRNQRGYGTQKNWMAVRQELLYYIKGDPTFNVQYTDIPKILRGYYKDVGGKRTENLERSKSDSIRPGNVWVDIQQVFYRMDENVAGCYAQKPIKAIDRIVAASSRPGDIVVDYFSHSGTSVLACERAKRRCFTIDIDPIFCEITIRRLEHFRRSGRLGWQNSHPFTDVLLKETIAAESAAVPQGLLF